MMRPYVEKADKKWRKVVIVLFVGLLVAFAASLAFGSVSLPFRSLVAFLTGTSELPESHRMILWNFRLPKAITAVLVGSGLGISGLQMQTLFRNPLAGPYVLGISSGAGLGVALAIFIGVHVGAFIGFSGLGRSWLLVAAAAAGAVSVLLVIAFASVKIKDSATLLIIGLMFGAASGAFVSILQFFSQAENIQAYVIWSFGALGSLSWEEHRVFVPLIVFGLAGSFFLSKPLNGLLLGENYAKSLGINLRVYRMLIIINTSILAGTVTAFCGPIAFFGIAMPHLARMLFNTTNHRLLTPLIILMGGFLMLVFDLVAQLPGVESSLPINAVTSLLGAPFVIYLLIKRKNLHHS